MVYKHAISTVVPARMVKIPMQNGGDLPEDDVDLDAGEPGNE